MLVLPAALLCLPAALAGPLRLQARQAASSSGPSVSIANGTVQGISIPGLGAEAFLGIPYAQPPTGQLRLARPVALNSTFSGGTFDATAFGPVCPGYGVSSYPNPAAGQNYVVDEDCLNIQIVRPAGVNDTAGLPVLFWIFGGGFVQGAANDPRYNGTYLVQRSVENGKPIIFASVNYRLAAFGFPAGQAAASEGVLNLGLRDQRMALQWVQDNIAAFGGDPAKVTIWGQSAGGQSAISQTIAYGGRDDGLFRAAISDSGAFSTQNSSVASQAPVWNRLLNATGCSDDLACLRALPFESFYAAANGTYNPAVVVDGDFVQAPFWSLYTERKFVNTPLMLGNNLDEATSGIGAPVGVNNDTAFEAAIRGNIANLNLADRNATVQQILSTFTNDPSQGCPFNTGPGLLPTGLQDKRVNWFYTDALAAGVRYVAQQHSQLAPTFKYHFVQIPQNGTIDGGVAHFFEIPYIFGVMNQTVRSPMSQRPADLVTSRAMQDYWINFVNDLDPGTSSNGTSWPAYSSGGQVLTIENDNIRPEPDTFRNTSIGYIIDTVSNI